MVVINIVGFPYRIKLKNGVDIIIPYDNQPHEVPDEIIENNFSNVFRILVPPKSKINETNKDNFNIIDETNKDNSNIIEINIDDNDEVELSEKNKKLPLKGIKIKSNIRNKLIKKRKQKDNKENEIKVE